MMKKTIKNKRLPMQTIILRTLYAAGLISTALLAPNALRLFAYLDRGKAHRNNFYNRVAQAVSRLKRRGLIVFEKKNGKKVIRLTEKGEAEISKILACEYKIPEPTLWDGKWRILIFDIKEQRRKTRNTLRRLLAHAGFVWLQDSVWVHPYPCDEFIAILRAHLESGVGEARVVIAQTIESDEFLRKHFGL